MKAFHGTTYENFVNLMKGGDKPSGAWKASDCDGLFYIYPIDKMITEFLGLDDIIGVSADDYEEARQQGLFNALASGSFTAALAMKTQKIVVLELEIPDEELQNDWSCENMAHIASCVYGFDKNWIKNVHSSEFHAMYSPFFIPDLSNPYRNEFPEELEIIVNCLGDGLYNTAEELRTILEDGLKIDNVLLNNI